MDSLQSLAVEDWPKLRDSYNEYMPFGLIGYNLLDTMLSMREKNVQLDFTPFCPYGDISNGMVAILVKNKLKEVIILPNSTDITKLEKALVTSKQIDWNLGRIQLPFTQPATRKCMEYVAPKLGIRQVMEGPAHLFAYRKNRRPFENVEYPEGTYVGPVKPGNIHRVNEVWPHKYTDSEWVFETFIQADQSYGLFRTEDNKLLAWMFICEAGFLCHLYCEEEHRRKKYAEFIVKYVANDRVRKRKDAFCYIVKGNVKSISLFKKLEFEEVGDVSWLQFDKID